MANTFFKLNLNHGIEPEKKNKTVLWVICSHAAVLFLMFITFSFKGCAGKPKENVIQVSLSYPNEQGMQAAQTVQQPVQKSQPVQPKPVQPKPQPKPQPQPVTKNIRKVPEKTPIAKPQPEAPKWKALDPSEILKSTKTVTKQVPAVPVQKYNPVNASAIASSLRSGLKSIKFSNSASASSSIISYYDEVSSYLYSRWQQPSRSVLGGKLPVVNVKITVDSNGIVQNFRVVSYSGISAMDDSVRDLLKNLSSLPRPPDGAMTIDVSLELEN